jgi:UDP-glucose 4-epimerase
LNHYLDLLRKGNDRREILDDLANSSEGRTRADKLAPFEKQLAALEQIIAHAWGWERRLGTSW